MRWRDALAPVTMTRIAIVAPPETLRDVLAATADEGTVQLSDVPPAGGPTDGASAQLLRLRPSGPVPPALSAQPPDLDRCEREGRIDLVAGEAELEQRCAQALTNGRVSGLVGWIPSADLARLAERVARCGGAVTPIVRPPGEQPPTLLTQSGTARELAPLVETYGTVPYVDVNPSVVAWLAYVVMFGMMFADAGHGALLLLAGLLVRWGQWPRLARLRPAWLFLAGAGVASMAMGALYGEFFGPTGVLPVLWLAPLEHPVELLLAGVAVGGVLLASAYALGIVNRFREGGWRRALYAPSGLAGAALFLGLALGAAGVYTDVSRLIGLGGAIAAAGLVFAFVGLYAAAGSGAGAAAQAIIELIDLVVRLGSNLVSFARLAAFGLTHAALCALVWDATTSLWHPDARLLAAVLIFVVGNILAFLLEGLVAAIQALRLEYYELFSRVFDVEGVPFRPWHIPLEVPR